MTKKDAEDYRYGYQHIGKVNGSKVSIRKASNCDGWIDLFTSELYLNKEVDIIAINNKPMSHPKHKYIEIK